MSVPSFRRLALLAPLGLTLAGCSWFKGDYDDVPCPTIGVPAELSKIDRFNGQGTSYNELAYRATLGTPKGDCKIDEKGVTVSFSLATVAEMGPAGTERKVDFPYFVAVTNGRNQVVSKRLLENVIAFPEGRNRAGFADKVDERIPLADPKTAGKYHVVIGFQFTPDEIAFERAQAKGN
jgi:hypothetical protein